MKKIKKAAPCFIAVVMFYIILSVCGIGCPIKYLTGVSCGGCGMTRAYYYLFKLDLINALKYHPLFWLVPPVIGIVIFKNRMNKRKYNIIMTSVVLIFILVYLLRLYDLRDDVVTFDIKNGLISRMVQHINGG